MGHRESERRADLPRDQSSGGSKQSTMMVEEVSHGSCRNIYSSFLES
jgi:hypothetical protein